MRFRSGRWLVAAVSFPLAVLLTVVLLRLQSQPAPHVAMTASAAMRSTAVVADLQRPPWYEMRLLHDRISFHEPAAAPAHPPNLKAAAGILVDLDSGRILWQVDDHARLAPASTIKLLTALVALENLPIDHLVTVTPDALHQEYDESRMFLHAGDTLSVRELLTGMLMVSANDAADALAIDTVGLERFVAAMNAQAQVLGLHDTHVTSPVGLDDPEMRSSAYDLAVLAAIDVRHFPLIRTIAATQWMDLPATSLHPEYSLTNINLLLSMYKAAVGLKTGYTDNAGACEVGMAVRDGHHLLSVILNGTLVYTESRRLLDWGFTQEGLPTQLPTPSPSPSPSPSVHR